MSSVHSSAPTPSARVRLATAFGGLEVELWAREAPRACRAFLARCVRLSRAAPAAVPGSAQPPPPPPPPPRLAFFRIDAGHFAQVGDPADPADVHDVAPGCGTPLELHSRLRFAYRGILAMVPHTLEPDGGGGGARVENRTQFFVTLAGPLPELDGANTVFGRVVGDSLFNLLRLNDVPCTPDGVPVDAPPAITGADVLEHPFEGLEEEVAAAAAAHAESSRAAQDGGPREAAATAACAGGRPGGRVCTPNLSLLSFGDEALAEPCAVPGARTRGRSRGAAKVSASVSASAGVGVGAAAGPLGAGAGAGGGEAREVDNDDDDDEEECFDTSELLLRRRPGRAAAAPSRKRRWRAEMPPAAEAGESTVAAAGATPTPRAGAPSSSSSSSSASADRKVLLRELRAQQRALRAELQVAALRARRGGGARAGADGDGLSSVERRRARYLNKRAGGGAAGALAEADVTAAVGRFSARIAAAGARVRAPSATGAGAGQGDGGDVDVDGDGERSADLSFLCHAFRPLRPSEEGQRPGDPFGTSTVDDDDGLVFEDPLAGESTLHRERRTQHARRVAGEEKTWDPW